MIYAIISASAILAIALAAALVREHRLRRALEALLKKLITAWMSQHAETETDNPGDPSDNRLQQTTRRTSN